MRTYELMVVLDPRISEGDATGLTGDIRKLLENSGGEILKTDVWGRRKLAYEIQKLKEGRYVLFYVSTEDGSHSLADAERRLQQHDQVLRYLLVRTDEDLRRAGLPLPTREEEAEAVAAGDAATEEPEAAAEKTEAAKGETAEKADEVETTSDEAEERATRIASSVGIMETVRIEVSPVSEFGRSARC